jgi:hypothetical protein
MIHPESVLDNEIVTHMAALEMSFVRTHLQVSFGKMVLMVHTKQKGILSLPLKAQWELPQNCLCIVCATIFDPLHAPCQPWWG